MYTKTHTHTRTHTIEFVDADDEDALNDLMGFWENTLWKVT